MDKEELKSLFERLRELYELRIKINSRKPEFGDSQVRLYQQDWDFIASYMPKTRPEFIKFMDAVRAVYDSAEKELTDKIEDLKEGSDNLSRAVESLKQKLARDLTVSLNPESQRLESAAMALRDYDENLSNELEGIARRLKSLGRV